MKLLDFSRITCDFARSKSLISMPETLGFAAQLCSKALPSLKDNKGPEVDAVVITIMVLATIAVSLRLIARRVSPKKYGMDDLLIVFALVRDRHLPLPPLIIKVWELKVI